MPESAKFLVVECGARKQGDFEEISSILKCDVFILTGIAGNHLETFGSIKEIENTKLQLRHSLEIKLTLLMEELFKKPIMKGLINCLSNKPYH